MLFLSRILSQNGKAADAIQLLMQVIEKYPRFQEAISAEALLTELRRKGK